MPIHCPIPIRNLTQPEFDERDKVVMRCVVTSFRDSGFQRMHLQRLLGVTQMRALHWFNLNRTVVECLTLEKQ